MLCVGQHFTHCRRIGVRDDDGPAQFPFSLGRFGCQYVAGERMMTHDLSAPGYLETLGRALVSF